MWWLCSVAPEERPAKAKGLLLHHVADYYRQAAVELVDQGLIETHRQHGPSMSLCRNPSFPSSSSCEFLSLEALVDNPSPTTAPVFPTSMVRFKLSWQHGGSYAVLLSPTGLHKNVSNKRWGYPRGTRNYCAS